MVCVGIYSVLVQNIGVGSNVSAAIWACMGYTVLLCFALVASIYAAANYGAVWSSMRGKLAESGVETNFLTKIKFDNRLYLRLGTDFCW